MKRTRNFGRELLRGLFLLLCSSFVFVSCKVGLGEAIDTVPPTVTITYPPAGSVVCGSFVLAGDCDDDTNVSSVDVYYERTGTHTMEKAKLATVDVKAGDRKWSLTIDPSTQDVKDGPYVFYAVAKDTEGRSSGTYTQSIEIDNTAPVMILTKPTSYGTNNPKEYGRSVSIEGTFAEATENRIDKLVVTFYDENGNKISFDDHEDTTFDDITDMSNANPLIIAKLYDTIEDDSEELVKKRDKIYRKLYGDDLGQGAKQFYFTVTAYDRARVFNNPSSNIGTGDGNATTNYYRGTNELLNLINGNIIGYSAFSVKNIQELLNGLDDSYANDDQVLQWLSDARVQSAAPSVSTPRTALAETGDLSSDRKEKTLNFSMNPANYPTFTVSGLEKLNPEDVAENDKNHTSEGYFKYYGGTPLNFSVVAGLDQTKIDVPSVSIYVAKWDSEHSRWMDGESERQLVFTWNPKVYKGKDNPTADDPPVLPESKFTPTSNGDNADSVAKTIALNFSDYEGMSNASKWKFIAVGNDINGQPIGNYSLNGYGFVASINAHAAKINIGAQREEDTEIINRNTNSVTNLNAYSVDKYKFDGTYSSPVDLSSFTYTVTVSDSTRPDTSWTSLPRAVNYEKTTDAGDGTWNVTVEPESGAIAYMNDHPGLYNVVVTFSAENIADTTERSTTLNIENLDPEIVLSSFTNSVEKEKADASYDGAYYIRSDNTFKIKGNTTDNYLVGNTELTLEGDGVTKTYTSDTPSWEFAPVFSGFSARDGIDVDMTITAYDKAGNSVTKKYEVEFDNAGPVAKHLIDAKNKDCIFRIGDWNDGAGGKYSSETWGNATTMKIRGAFEDEGSGVDMIYYQLYKEEDEASITKLTAENYKTVCTGGDGNGYFAPLANSYKMTVERNTEHGKVGYEALTNFEAILTGFKEGTNILRLVAVDKVGNARLDSVELDGQVYDDYSLNVDLHAPKLEYQSISILTNGENEIDPINGDAIDVLSGVDKLEFYIGSEDYKIWESKEGEPDSPYGSIILGAPDADGKRSWTLNISNENHWLKNDDVLAAIGRNPGVYANVTDKAGLTLSAVKVAALTLDLDAPTVIISDIKDANTSTREFEVNGIINIPGTASDGANALPETPPQLYYRTQEPPAGTVNIDDWQSVVTTQDMTIEGNNWKCKNLDTTAAFGSLANGTPVWLMASITDKAGNTGYSEPKPIIVDQNTDRPKITFTDLEDKDSWLQSKELRGSITDDDGIQLFKVHIGETCPSDWTSCDSESTGYTVASSTGSWHLEEDKLGDDGPKKVWFYVKDSAGKEFISGSGTELDRPYYLYSKTNPGVGGSVYGLSADSFVEVNKDIASPKLWTTLVTIGTDEAELEGISQIKTKPNFYVDYSLNSGKISGGKQSYFKLYVPVLEMYVDKVTAVMQDEDGNDDTEKLYFKDSLGNPVSKEEIEFSLTEVTYKSPKDHLTYTYYESELIDVTKAHLFGNIKSGVKSVQITVKDMAGNERSQTCSITIDNEGPSITMTSPSSTDAVTGVVDVTGTSLDGDSSVTKTYWMIPDSTQLQDYRSSSESIVDAGNWSDHIAENSTATSWKFSFNGEVDGNPLLTKFDKNRDDPGITYYTNYDSDSKIYELPLLIKSVDKVGNSSIKEFILRHNPDGDMPQVAITYPTSANYAEGQNFAVLGGTILVTGNVNIPSGTSTPDYVFLQIATGSQDFGNDSKQIAQDTYDLDVWDVNRVLEDVADDPNRNSQFKYTQIEGFEDGEESTWWGIKATRTGSSWYIPLNSNEKMNPVGDETTNIWIRACGINYNGKIGGWSQPVVAVRIDANAPVLSASLRQYSIANPSAVLETAVPTAVNSYTADMFIKGDWYLTVDMTDETSLQTVSVKKGDSDLTAGTDYYLTEQTKEDGGPARRTLWIKVDSSGNSASYTVSVTDTEGPGKHISTAKYTLNIDNEAPTLKNLKGNGDVLEDDSVIAEKDYVYTLSGEVEEKGSGFERILFYFVRPDKEIINPMVKPTVVNPDEVEYAKTSIGGLQPYSLIPDYDMYGKNIQGKVQEYTFVPDTASEVTGDRNIRVGGLIFIEGIYRKITAVSQTDGKVTFDSNTGISTQTEVTAGFPYGQVIDNMSTEKIGEAGNAANPFVLTNDDGDLMPETVNKLGSSYTWDGTIHSKNMPDGPVTLVVLAFDKAGNVSGQKFTPKVQNNAPRVAKIYLGTNLNGDSLNGTDRYTLNEFNTYSIIGAIGNAAETFELDTSADVYGYKKPFVVKDKLAVVPEIVGGNGNIALYYKLDATDTTAVTKNTGTNAAVIASGNLPAFTAGEGNKIRAYQIAELGPDAESKSIGLTFWDSTAIDELEQGLSTQNCTVLVTNLKIDQVDNEPPESTIDTFYWKSLNDNSIYGSETATKVSDLKGHIELESDLSQLVKDRYGNDPKVSGKIRITGKSHDGTRLDEISFAMTSLKLNNKAKGTSVVLARYDTNSDAENEEDKWILTEGYSSHTAGGNIDTDGWQFRILTDSGLGQDGHSVTWELDIDTARIEGIVSLNEILTTTAKDAGNNNSTPGNVQTTKDAATGRYQMDVVPYISGIDTSLYRKLKSSIKNAYSRTALGHYVARSDEDLAVKGFNLGSPSTETYFGISGGIRLDVSADGVVTLPATKAILATSGEISLSVKNGDTYIQTLNNLNNNYACGSYSNGITENSPYSDKNRYAYNLMPNSNSNSLLTDDVIIDVWEFDSDAAKPKSGELREPVMSINPKTGKVGVAFVSGPGDFAMAGGLNGKYAAADNSDPTKDLYSYALWQNNFATYNNVAFAYDALGNAHATATGLDTNPSSKHAGRFSYFYNKWGQSGTDQNGNYNGSNAIRLESIAVPYIVPTPTAETFDGTVYATSRYKVLANGEFIETSAGALTETRFSSPSLVTTVHGAESTATTSVYLAYYDSVQKQIRFRYSSSVPATKSNKYDFVDNSGYKQNGDTGSYMEANTNNFSLIAGVDTQQGEDHFTAVGGTQKVLLNKKDENGEDLYKMTDYRQAKIGNDGSVTDAKDKGYTIAEFPMDETILGSLQEDLKSRFTVGQNYKWIQNGNYRWIIQDDGLIYYTTEANPAKGYMTLVPSTTYQGHDKSVKVKDNPLRKLDPDEHYIVYEKVGLADSSISEGDKNNQVGTVIDGTKYKFYQQPNYFWPYSNGEHATVQSEALPKAIVYSSYDTGYSAYKYVAIDAMPGSDAAPDKVVAVWYDGTNCLYAYNDNPTSGKDNGSAGGWKGNKIIFTEGGEHCTVKIDPNGGVHIAAYVDGSLRYAYLSSCAADYSEATDSVKVDSFTITGERITLDVGKDASGNVIPYISYFNGTARLPCVARLVVPENGVMNYKAQGTNAEDMFTGNWEISLVPSSMILTTNYYDKMNIGLWKQEGVIVSGNDSRFTVTGGESGKTSANNTSGTDNGSIYGNGTANPILGYAVESSSGTNLETAQMR